jgi:hypothetical protein
MENVKQSAFACANEYHLQQGLTKREYFAAMAMQGFIACQEDGFRAHPETIAMIAVQCADALLAELEQTEKQEGCLNN